MFLEIRAILRALDGESTLQCSQLWTTACVVLCSVYRPISTALAFYCWVTCHLSTGHLILDYFTCKLHFHDLSSHSRVSTIHLYEKTWAARAGYNQKSNGYRVVRGN